MIKVYKEKYFSIGFIYIQASSPLVRDMWDVVLGKTQISHLSIFTLNYLKLKHVYLYFFLNKKAFLYIILFLC